MFDLFLGEELMKLSINKVKYDKKKHFQAQITLHLFWDCCF